MTGGYAVYGPLLEAGLPGVDPEDGMGEHEACERAQALVGEADAALASRLDFDPEAGGTGVLAPSAEDLERFLRLLKIVS